MATSHPDTPGRIPDRRLTRRGARRATPPTDPTRPTGSDGTDPDNPYRDTPGHPAARGTLPMARRLLDLATEDEIQALAAEAGPMSEDQRATLARLLRLNRPRDRAA
ncbi:hypothetical protein AB0M46_30070 [Dactylosporangium sp. NPDC051485]|uniref:hypothetical protein n=1 Tax=Dactylosporangium sp. NPDC051485 TaxID=3154846 RepID=UPI00341366EA